MHWYCTETLEWSHGRLQIHISQTLLKNVMHGAYSKENQMFLTFLHLSKGICIMPQNAKQKKKIQASK